MAKSFKLSHTALSETEKRKLYFGRISKTIVGEKQKDLTKQRK